MDVDDAGPVNGTLAFEPKPILALDDSVVNRIAAGEIIQRPANALKELIENSLDAGAKTIRVTVKEGGLKLLQIQDDGCGIRHADLPILCQRFTTSKLRTFDDLSRMTTYGFRGEALASISHVAHVAVLTMTEGASCAWRANYSDGVLVPPKPGESVEPRSAAGNKGTTITVEDLFFNVPSRKRALRNVSDEFARVVDVVTKYAVHNPSVSFVCKKAGVASPSVSTPSRPSSVDTIQLVYGPTLAKSLLPLPSVTNASLGLESAEGWVSGAGYNARKAGGFVAFVNHRLVDVPRLKKAVESVYVSILPKGTLPWLYISLMIKQENIDVNVHPTKKEVHFLNEEEIVDEICRAVEKVLVGANESRDFAVQDTQGTLGDYVVDKGKGREVQPAPDPDGEFSGEDEMSDGGGGPSSTQAKLHPLMDPKVRYSTKSSSIVPRQLAPKNNPKFQVRVSDPTVRTLDSMFAPVQRPADGGGGGGGAREEKRRRTDDVIEVDMSSDEEDDGVDWIKDGAGGAAPDAGGETFRAVAAGGPIRESHTTLTSVGTMRADVQHARHVALSEIIKDHKFVGVVDYDLSMSLLQHRTRLYLVDHAALSRVLSLARIPLRLLLALTWRALSVFGSEELFYQLGLLQFGEVNKIRLEPPPEIGPMLDVALELEDDLPADRRARAKKMLLARILDAREMLDEYFSLVVSADGTVECLPSLLEGYTPDLRRLPHFLMRIGACVNWEDEQDCFKTFLRELAFFYVPVPIGIPAGLSAEEEEVEAQERKQDLFQLEHVVFPAFRRHLVPPKSLLKHKNVTQVADLPDLYKTFERC